MNPWTIWVSEKPTQSISFVNKVTKRLVKRCFSPFTFSLDLSPASDLCMAQTTILFVKFWLSKILGFLSGKTNKTFWDKAIWTETATFNSGLFLHFLMFRWPAKLPP